MSRYFDELKRRNVFRVGAAYAVVGWLVIEVVDTLAPRMAMPDWVPGFFIMLVLIGFPIALLFSWAFEMTPEGLRKTADVDVGESITTTTGQKINYVIIAALAAVVLFQQFAPPLSTITRFADAAEPIAIAVLPFADLSAAGDQEYLGDGVAEEILNVLAGIDGLKVTSRTSAFAFKGQNQSIPDIAAALGASHVVEGSVRKQDAKVRITAQLIEVSGDSHLWSETYDSDLSDIFRLQDEIANKISSALSTRLNLALPSVERQTPDWDIAAYELYLRARQLVLARIDFEGAIELLNTAIRIEPEFADAWAEKASALALRAYELGATDEAAAEVYEMYDEAWVAASRAVELDAAHSLGSAVQGLVRVNQLRLIEARVLLERSMSNGKGNDNAVLWLGILQAMTGDADGALATLEAGLVSSPTAPNLIRWRDLVLSTAGRWQEIWDSGESAAAIEMEQAIVLKKVAGLQVGAISAAEFEAWARAEFPDATAQDFDVLARLAEVTASGSTCTLEGSAVDSAWSSELFVMNTLVTSVCPDFLGRTLEREFAAILASPHQNQLTYFWGAGLADFRSRPETQQLFSDLALPAYWDLYGWPKACRRTDVSDFVCD